MTHTLDELQQMASESDSEMHQQMADMTAETMSHLENLEGDEFDKHFLSMTLVHHKQMLVVSELVASRTAHEELKQFAADMIEHQQGEIEKMQSWQEEWGLK